MDAPKQTFPAVLQFTPARGRIITEQKWIKCPVCGRGRVLRTLPTTEIKDLPVYCKVCKTETVVNISQEPEP